MTRDLALILLAGVLVVVACLTATLLAVAGKVDPVAALGVATAAVGIGGVALGRLGPPTDPAPLPDEDAG